MSTPPVTRHVAALRARPEQTALLFDFDGTLASIVDDPAAARPLPGVPELLDALAARYAVVAIVSGRPVSFLGEHLPATLALSGLYGLETMTGGRVVHHPDADRWRPVVADAARDALDAAAPDGPLHGMVVEAKGLSLTLHVRTHPHLETEAVAFARRLASSCGLEARTAKRSVELHPPIPADKGTAVRNLRGTASAVLFAGDDVGDLPAFDALAELRRTGEVDHAVGVAVGGPELDAEVARRADLLLADQDALVAMLEQLLVP